MCTMCTLVSNDLQKFQVCFAVVKDIKTVFDVVGDIEGSGSSCEVPLPGVDGSTLEVLLGMLERSRLVRPHLAASRQRVA